MAELGFPHDPATGGNYNRSAKKENTNTSTNSNNNTDKSEKHKRGNGEDVSTKGYVSDDYTAWVKREN